MIGYKVVGCRRLDGALTSAVRHQIYNRKGKTVRQPGCGPLAVFKRLQDAQNFAYWWVTSARIFVVQYKRSRARSLWYGMSKRVPAQALPDGTDFADWIKLGAEYPLAERSE